MVEAWAIDERRYEMEPTDGDSFDVWLSEDVLVNYFTLFAGGTIDPTTEAKVRNLLNCLSDGVAAINQANYVVMRTAQIPISYSKVTDFYAGVDQYWNTAQLQAIMPPWLVTPPVTGKWLKKAPTQRLRATNTLDFEERWEHDRNPQSFLYQDYSP
jgi:hypothetical protein